MKDKTYTSAKEQQIVGNDSVIDHHSLLLKSLKKEKVANAI